MLRSRINNFYKPLKIKWWISKTGCVKRKGNTSAVRNTCIWGQVRMMIHWSVSKNGEPRIIARPAELGGSLRSILKKAFKSFKRHNEKRRKEIELTDLCMNGRRWIIGIVIVPQVSMRAHPAEQRHIAEGELSGLVETTSLRKPTLTSHESE